MVGESQGFRPVAERSIDGEIEACDQGLKSWRRRSLNVNRFPEETMRARNVISVFVSLISPNINTTTTIIFSKFRNPSLTSKFVSGS